MADFFEPHVLARIKGYELRSMRLVESYMAGMHKSRLLGISTDFAQHRQYVPGDDTRHLDWKVFAKTDRYFIKQYEAETNMQVVFLLDASKSMFFRGQKSAMSKFEYAATTVSALCYLLSQQKDAFGLALFDARVRTLLPAKGSHAHLRNLVDVLEKARPGEETDLCGVFFSVAPQLKRRSLVVLLSDFVSDIQRLSLGVGQIHFGQHDMVLLHVEDPLERDFPFAGQTIFLGSEGEGKLLCEPRDMRHAYLAARDRHLEAVRQSCLQFGYVLEHMPTDAPLDETLSRLLSLRQARRRRR
jgi:uncharacterized protein (DUF58 family)